MVKTCEICGMSYGTMRRFKGVQMLCPKHYNHMKRHGRILEHTKYDDVHIVINDHRADIVLYNNDNIEVGRAMISLDRVDKCKTAKWYLHHSGYVYGKIGKKNIQLSRFISDVDDDRTVDHRDGNTLNNLDDNLRICTTQQNSCNRNHSIKGVRQVGNKWYGRVKHNYVEHTTNGCNTQEEAIIARNELAFRLHGEFATIIGGNDDDGQR